MKFKVRRLFTKYRTGAGFNSPVSGILFWGKKIQTIDKLIVDGTEWIKFAKGKKIVWVNINDLKICRY